MNFIFFTRDKISSTKDIENIKTSGKPVVVFFPTTDWFDLKQRPQHLARAFSETGSIVLFMTKNQTKDTVQWIQKINDSFYLLENFYLADEFQNYTILITGPSNYPLLKQLKNYTFLVYDFPDELSFFPWISENYIYNCHLKLLEKATLITPSATFLEEVIQKDYPSRKTQVLLNGVFPNDFFIEPEEQLYIPDDMKTILKKWKKVIGFYWGLWEKRIDFSLIQYCFLNRSDYEFVFIWSGNIEYLRQKYNLFWDNIYFLWPKPYEMLKHYAKYFDVALIPFLLNDFTLWVSPVKSFEYMVQWIPFVSSGLPECKKYKNVLLWNSYKEFVEKIDEGISKRSDDHYRQSLREEWKENSWFSRASLIYKILENGKN